jgi:hypothetical protein
MFKNFRIVFIYGIVIVSLLISWAALHDIIKGEEDITSETAALVLSFILIIYSVYKLRKLRTRRQKTL